MYVYYNVRRLAGTGGEVEGTCAWEYGDAGLAEDGAVLSEDCVIVSCRMSSWEDQLREDWVEKERKSRMSC